MSHESAGIINGFHMFVVSAGSIVFDQASGRLITVDDDTIAVKGNVAWVTQPMFDRIKLATTPAQGSA